MDDNSINQIIPIPQPTQLEEKKLKRKLLLLKWSTILFMFFMFFIVIDAAHIYFHEKVHAAIYDSYGVEYTYGWKFEGVAIVFYVATEDASKCDVVCQSLQMENEIYSYNIAYIFYAMWMIFFIYMMKCLWEDTTKKWQQI